MFSCHTQCVTASQTSANGSKDPLAIIQGLWLLMDLSSEAGYRQTESLVWRPSPSAINGPDDSPSASLRGSMVECFRKGVPGSSVVSHIYNVTETYAPQLKLRPDGVIAPELVM